MRPLSALSILVLATSTLAGCSEEPPAPPPIRPVLSVVAAPRNISVASYSGSVEPRYSTDLAFRVLGRMVSRTVDVGDTVTAGQRIAALDPLTQALTVRAAESDLSKAEAQFENARGTLERQRALLERKAATAADFEAAEQAGETAEAAVVQARSALAKAREQLGYTEIVADTDGVVTAVNAEVGQTIASGQTVMTLARADIREAVVDLPDDLAGRLGAGASFVVTLQIDPTIRSAGKVREIAPEADAATRLRRVRITLESPPEAFRIGTTVTAAPTETDTGAIELPRTAVLSEAGQHFVWVVDEATATVSKKPVQIADETAAALRVDGGIEVGTRVATAGVHTLTEGQTIKFNQDPAP